MCIAILSPEGTTIPNAHLVESFLSNPDGAGFMYAEDNELHIKKGFMTYEDFFRAYEPHQEKPIAVHFRITTHGDTDKENTHPFRVGSNLGFIHNGIINNVDCSSDKTRSDTYHFNTKYLSQFYKRDSRFIFKEHFKDIIKSYIGYSKLVFLNNKGHHTIVNEDKGLWEDGVWYSNSSFRAPVKKSLPAPTTVAGYQKQTNGNTPVGVFSVGSRVSIEIKGEKDFGYIRYFQGGLSVGVYVPSSKSVEIIPMVFLTPLPDLQFNKGDWVVQEAGDHNKIYVVTGTSKNKVWAQPLNDQATGYGPAEVFYDYELSEWSYLGASC